MATEKSYLQYLTEKRLRELGGSPSSNKRAGSSSSPLGRIRGIEVPTTNVRAESSSDAGDTSAVGRVLDVLARPAYAVGNIIKNSGISDAITDLVGDEEERAGINQARLNRGLNFTNQLKNRDFKGAFNTVTDTINDASKGAWAGFSGKSKIMPSNALLDNWDVTPSTTQGPDSTQVLRFGAGLAADIFLDPTTYIGPGAVRAVASKIPGVAKAGAALEKSGNAVKKTAPVAEDIAKVTDNVTEDAIPATLRPLDATGTSATESIKKAANAARSADGRRVYDFTRLPSLYARPRPSSAKATAEAVETPSEWARRNADAPITRTSEGKIAFSTIEDSDAATLGQLLGAAQRAGNKRDLQLVRELFETSGSGASKTTPSALQTAQAGAGRATGGRLDRVRGARRAEVLAKYRDVLDDADFNYLVNSRGADDFAKRRKEILSRVASPLESSSIADSPSDSVLRRLLGQVDEAPTPTRPSGVINPTNADVTAEVQNAVQRQLRPEGVKTGSVTKTPEGIAVSDRGFNKRAQYGVYSGLLRRASERLKGGTLAGGTRAAVLQREVLQNIDEAEAVLRSRGIEPILGSGNSGLALSFGDILHALDKSPSGRSVLINRIFDRKKGSIAVTNLADAYELMFNALREAGITNADEAADFIRSMKSVKGEEGSLLQQMGWELLKDPGGNYSKTAEAATRRVSKNQPELIKGITKLEEVPAKFRTIDGKVERVAGRTFKTTNVGGKEATAAVREIVSAITDDRVIKEIIRRSNANAAAYGAKLSAEVDAIADPVVDEFFTTWLRPTTSTGEAIRAYNRLDSAVDAAAKAQDAMPASRAAAKDVVDLGVADELAQDIPNIQSINRIVEAAQKGDVDTVVRTAQKMHNANAAEAVEASLTRVVDLGENIEASLDNNILRAMFPMLSKTPESLTGKLASTADKIATKFMPAAGHATLRPAATTMRSVARQMGNYWRSELTDVNRAFTGRTEDLKEVFARLQNGTAQITPGSPEERLQSLVKVLFETGEDGTPGAMGAFFRNGYDLEHLNNTLHFRGLPDSMQFDLGAARTAAAEKGTKVIDELADQWKSWKVDDPIDFMARMQSVMQTVSGDSAIAREAYRIASSKNLASMTQKKGFKQIGDSSGKSLLARYLPQGAWYHPDIIDEIRAMDRVLTESQSFTSGFGQFVNRYLDPALSMFKSGMTIYRPGHHVRNLIGDEGLSYLADGVQSVRHKYNAVKVMATRNAYTDWDAIRALEGMPPSARITASDAARGAEKVSQVTLKGGKKVDLSAAEVQEAMRSRGTLPDFVTGEDLLETPNVSPTVKKAQDALGSVFKGRVRQTAGRVSEARDDYVRISHFLHILEKNKNKFSSIEDALDFAAARIRKWHPDGTDLSNWESKYMRRVFPFYSWTRKAIPLVVESMLMQPGRILLYPKAMYNLAAANGIDVTSFSDPFPEDQLFPSFITDAQTGPVADIDGSYYTINPGLPNVDIMNDFIGDPKAALAGMLSPFIKAPVELATGTNLATGSNIADRGQYIERSIPGLSHFNQLTGGTLAGSIAEGQLGQDSTSLEQRVGPFDRLALINFLSGLGIQNVSKPSYINIAEMEARDRAAREANGG